MNGAESLARTLLACGVDTVFANPGTSEMHFVSALDRVPGIRCVLGTFEGVVTAAADGYARMAGKPAATLLHCGPGLANGLANLHNARRAHQPLVNIVGDQATSAGALLRSCAAYESFLRTYRGVLDPSRATAFLLLDRLFPRSVYAALSTAERRLAALLPASDTRLGVVDPGLVALGRLRTDLEFTSVTEVMDDLQRRLDAVQRVTGIVSDSVADRFFRGSSAIEWVAGAVS